MGAANAIWPSVLTTILIMSSAMKLQLAEGRPQVPCMFFFGDSQFDNGNNNVLLTLAKVNYPPYGIDYPDGPTGRFANGPIIPDYLAQLLGYDNSVPSFVSARGPSIAKGVNYASGAAGILNWSGALSGDRFTMNEQLQNHQLAIGRIALSLRRNLSSIVNDYLNKCLYVVNIGSNDYINNYLLPQYTTRFYYTPDSFAELLIQRFSRQLRTLHSYGARKVAVFGLGLLGCLPAELATNPVNASGCVDSINNIVQLYNNRLKPLIDTLNSNLPNAQFTYINITSISLGGPSPIGVRVVNASCCPVSATTGLCVRNSVPCSNRSEYAFWDNFHPTSLLNLATASRAYNAALPSDASPVDISGLVQQ